MHQQKYKVYTIIDFFKQIKCLPEQEDLQSLPENGPDSQICQLSDSSGRGFHGTRKRCYDVEAFSWGCNRPSCLLFPSEQEMKHSLKILLELEMAITGCGNNPFASLKPEQAYSNPNKAPVYSNSHYLMFYGLSDQSVGRDIGEVEEEEGPTH